MKYSKPKVKMNIMRFRARDNSGVISGSGGNFIILFVHMLIVRVVQHGNILINSLSIKFSKFPPLPEISPE